MNRVRQILQSEVQKEPITFERFMEVALYCPEGGYYRRADRAIGTRGDFYTSVATGPVFGELLAFRFAGWLEALHLPELHLVEAGAHDGSLGRDILNWLRDWRPDVYARVTYWIVEPSSQCVARQKVTMGEFAPRVSWCPDPAALPEITGIIFSNELLDAFPVRRLGWDAAEKAWFEWGVAMEDNGFVWRRLEGIVETPAVARGLEEVLPDSYTIEVAPSQAKWWTDMATRLRKGKLIAIDYGYTSERAIVPERTGGTVRAFREHQLVADVLENPGEQDITADVNFSELRTAGESAGLVTEALMSQEQFLTAIAGDTFTSENFAKWAPERTRQLQTLTHPQHLGRKFTALVQTRL